MQLEELRPGMLVTDDTGYTYVVSSIHPIEPDDPPDLPYPGVQINTLCGNVVFYPAGRDGFTLVATQELPDNAP